VPGLDVRLAFGRIRNEVMRATNNRQEPFVYGALGGDNVALVPAPPQPGDDPDTESDFKLVDSIGTMRAYEIFLQHHPDGPYADQARKRIEMLRKKMNYR
jgi:hypothetical protein